MKKIQRYKVKAYQCWFIKSFCVIVNVHSLLFKDSSSYKMYIFQTENFEDKTRENYLNAFCKFYRVMNIVKCRVATFRSRQNSLCFPCLKNKHPHSPFSFCCRKSEMAFTYGVFSS